jgi:hypothetical protein
MSEKQCETCCRYGKGKNGHYCGTMEKKPSELFCHMTVEQAKKAHEDMKAYAKYYRGR